MGAFARRSRWLACLRLDQGVDHSTQASVAGTSIEDRAWLRAFVSALTDRHEASFAEPWKVTDAPAEYVDGMTGAIVGLELPITRLIGKWKMSQNRNAQDRTGVVEGLLREGGEARADVAEHVRRAMTE